MEDLIQVIVVSSAPPEASEHDAVQLLNEARKANRQNDVSGMMIYTTGCFLLALEGEAAKVDVACRMIFSGKRDMKAIFREGIAEREFPEWTMGFETVEPLEAARLLGKPLGLETESGTAQIEAESAKTLFSIIGRRRWQSDRSGMFRAIRRTNRAATPRAATDAQKP